MAPFWNATAEDNEGEYVFKPVIKELVRTEVCPKVLRLLVEKIRILPVQNSEGEACQTYQVWLSDGEKMIQALLKPELHPFITVGEIGEGSYVELKKYFLAKAKKLSTKGEILYLHVDDLVSCDEGNRERNCNLFDNTSSFENSPIVSPKRPEPSPSPEKQERDTAHTTTKKGLASPRTHVLSPDILAENEAVDLVSLHDHHIPLTAGRGQDGDGLHREKEQRKRKLEDGGSPGPLKSIAPNFQSSPSRSPKRSRLQDPADAEVPRNSAGPKDPSPLPSTPKPPRPISRPLKVTPLADLIGRRAVRGRVLDVCVLICFVSEEIIKRRDMPDIRHLRVTDLSTRKRVLFSCCTNPHRFFPPVGTVALLRNVSTHEWDGGSLNAYPRDCAGREWFIPDPVGIDGCDVDGLRKLWDTIYEVEANEHLRKEIGL